MFYSSQFIGHSLVATAVTCCLICSASARCHADRYMTEDPGDANKCLANETFADGCEYSCRVNLSDRCQKQMDCRQEQFCRCKEGYCLEQETSGQRVCLEGLVEICDGRCFKIDPWKTKMRIVDPSELDCKDDGPKSLASNRDYEHGAGTGSDRGSSIDGEED